MSIQENKKVTSIAESIFIGLVENLEKGKKVDPAILTEVSLKLPPTSDYIRITGILAQDGLYYTDKTKWISK